MTRRKLHFSIGAVAALSLIWQAAALADMTRTSASAEKDFSAYYAGLADSADLGDEADSGDSAETSLLTEQYGYASGYSAQSGRHFIAGAEATFLWPTNVRGGSVSTSVTDGGSGTTNTVLGDEFDNLYVAPRIWLGVQGEKWGLLFRYWGISDSETSFTPFAAPGGSTSFNRLDAYVIDLELTRRFCYRATDMTAGFGVRYVEFDSQSFASGSGVVGTDIYSNTALSDRHIGATGLTFALSGLRPINTSHWNVFWNARGSVLWGDARRRVETSSFAQGPGGAAGFISGAESSASDTLFIGEIQAGLQRDFPLTCVPATAFFRAAFEYQYWDADGSGSAISTSGATLPGGLGTATAAAGDIRMDLVGFTLGTGFYW